VPPRRILRLTAKNVMSLPSPPRGQKDYPGTGGVRGLSLRVTAAGKRVFTLYYRVRAGKKTRRVSLGEVGVVSLTDARAKARLLLRDVDLGSDPMARREIGDFAAICERFKVEFCPAKERSAHVRETWPLLIDRYILPAMGPRKPTDEGMRAKVVEFTDAIAREGKGHMANRVFEIARRVWTWGIQKALISEANYPFLRLKKPYKEVPRRRFYRTEEIRQVWKAIEQEVNAFGGHPEGGRVVAGFFKMLWYTAARRGEVAAMRRDNIDMEKHQGTVYERRTSSLSSSHYPGKRWRSSRSSGPWPETGGSPFVFFSVRPDARQGHIDATSGAPSARIRRRAGIADFRIHDIRRTVRTNLAEMGVRREVAEAILNHKQDRMGETYNRHSYQLEMRDALQRWADKLDSVVKRGRGAVVPLARA
jgi:integrase